MFSLSLPLSPALFTRVRLYFWNASGIPEFTILSSSSLLHITSWLLSLVPIWSLFCRPQTFNTFPLPTNIIQALYPGSQIFSLPSPNLHFSSQNSERLKNLSLGMDFRSHLVYPSIHSISTKWSCLTSVPSSRSFAYYGSDMFMTISSLCECFFTSALFILELCYCLLRHLHPCLCSSHHSRSGWVATTAMKNDCCTQIMTPASRIVL